VKRLVVIASVGLVLTLACGGHIVGDDAGVGGDGGTIHDGAGGDGGWTLCSSPDGYMVCGGPNDCNAGTECAKACAGTTELEPCGSNATTDNYFQCDDPPCPDGYLCLLTDGVKRTDAPLLGECVVDQIGQLFHLNSEDSRLLYADFSAYDGAPLPNPSSCPTSGSASLVFCGGSCGDTCPHDGPLPPYHACFGRSPNHPYSICAVIGPSCTPSDQSGCVSWADQTATPQGCMIFVDDAASQPNADAHGLCVPQDTCQAAASFYPPGGAVKCIVP